MPPSFVHLHTHSSYSLLDGAGQIEDYAGKAKADGQPALAITDHGTLSGLPELETVSKKVGIKPIYGIELYSARKKVSDRPNSKVSSGDESQTGKAFHHLLALALNQKGYENLIELSTEAYLDGYYYKPRVDFEMLDRHSEGVMVTSSCLGGIILQELIHDRQDAADEAMSTYIDIFGKDRFVVEIQDHGIDLQHKTNPKLIEMARRFGLRIVATGDCHYVNNCDHDAHDILLCTQVKGLRDDPNRFKFNGTGHYLKTAEEMRYIFREIPEACDNTLWVAEQVENIQIIKPPTVGNENFPKFETPDGSTSEAYLRKQLNIGVAERYGDPIPANVIERVKTELSVFVEAGFADYFLILQDIVQESKRMGWMASPGRGCLTADTRVHTENGYVKLPDIEVGAKVLTHTGQYREVLNKQRYECDEKLLKINSGFGSLTMTKDHKVYALKLNDLDLSWVEARNLFPGDSVYNSIYSTLNEITSIETAPSEPVYDIEVDEDHSYMTDSFVVHNSSAGCAVAYCLGITHLDPIKYGLPFERFYSADRVGSPPDIDLDVEPRARDHLIRYISDKYGADKVCQIVTFSYIHAKAAIKDVSRALGHPPFVGDQLSKMMPAPVFGRNTPLCEVLAETPSPKWKGTWPQGADARKSYSEDKVTKEIFDLAMGIEGLIRQHGIHAGAVVVSPRPLTSYLPLQKKPEEPLTTQYSMNDVERLGLLKIDLLGLNNLSIVTDTIKLLDESLDPYDIGEGDELTYRLLGGGHTVGIFQLESPPMQQLLRDMQPTSLDDVAAVLSAYRPGPMAAGAHVKMALVKHGHEKPSYLHPDLEPILRRTYGQFLEQEQLMEIAKHFAGYTGVEANSFRKIAAKKQPGKMAEQYDKFIQGCCDNDFSDSVGMGLWRMIEGVADYLFTKSHSYAYGLLSIMTAYLKAHHPQAYMASLLSNVDSLEKAGPYLHECNRLGLDLKLPHINHSLGSFAPVDDRIYFGLEAIRDVGEGPSQAIIFEREFGGEFKSFDDLQKRVSPSSLNKKVLRGLASAGALDDFGSRGGLLSILEDSIDSARSEEKRANAGHQSFFQFIEYERPATIIPEVSLTNQKIRELEREFIGIAVSYHPLRGWEEAISKRATHPICDLVEGRECTIAGYLSMVAPWVTKAGAHMATLTLEDLSGSQKVTVFAKLWATTKVVTDQVVAIQGRLKEGDFLASSIEAMDYSLRSMNTVSAAPMVLKLHEHDLSGDKIQRLREVLTTPAYTGLSEVRIDLGERIVSLGGDVKVVADNPLLAHDLRQLFQREVVEGQ